MEKTIIKKIKSGGYWRIQFMPKPKIDDRISSLSVCRGITRKAVVELRGWDYPHFPTQNDEKQRLDNYSDYIGSWIDWESYKELWRMYLDGAFIHYFGMLEDWYSEDSWSDEARKSISPGSILDIVHVIFRVTEIFEFFSRLVKQKIYEDTIIVEIALFKTNERKLVILDPVRVPLVADYKAAAPEIIFKKEYTAQEVINKPAELALEVILFIFERFNWNNPSIGMIKSDQRRLLERKF